MAVDLPRPPDPFHEPTIPAPAPPEAHPQ